MTAVLPDASAPPAEAAPTAAPLGDTSRPAAPLGDTSRPAAPLGDTSRPAAPLLACAGLDVSYGRSQILFGVDLDVYPGEVVAVLGTNGAGKSTLLRAISGLTPPGAGRVVFDGVDLTAVPTAARAALGLAHMPGGRGIFPELTVGENLRMATWTARRRPDRGRPAVERALDLFPALAGRLDERAGLLSGGQQQMLALAQAFIPEPRLLLVDELSLGLAPVVVAELLAVVRAIRDAGTAVVLVEQSADLCLGVADHAVFLEKGEVRYSGPAEGLAERSELVRSVFLAGAADDLAAGAGPAGDGGDGAQTFRRFDLGALERVRPPVSTSVPGPPGSPAAPALAARGLRIAFGGVRAVDGLDLDVSAGEIVGLMGPNGAGKTTVLDLLSGFAVPDAGTVVAAGADITHWPADARARAGLGRSFQDARLFPGLTVAETLAVSCERWVTSREPLAAALRLPASLISEALVAERVERIVGLLHLDAFQDRLTGELSTGTRRLVELGCLLAAEPDVLLLDEPSAGLARAEAEALGPVLRRIRDVTGAAVVLVEHDVALLRATCDRLVALDAGREVAQGPPAQVLADPLVVSAYLGDTGTPHPDQIVERSTRPSPRPPSGPAAEPGPVETVRPAPDAPRVLTADDRRRRATTRTLIGVLIALAVAKKIGEASAPALLLNAPLLLVALSPDARYLLLASQTVNAGPLMAVALARRLSSCPVVYHLGRLHGRGTLGWFDRRFRRIGRMMRAIERWFGRWPAPVSVAFPGGLTVFLAGDVRMPMARILGCTAAGLLIRICFTLWLGEVFSGPLEAVLGFVGDHQGILTAATMGLTAFHLLRQRRHRHP